MIYVLTVFRNSTCKDVTNIYDLVTYETLEDAIEYASQYNLPYIIEESNDEKIFDFDPSEDDDVIDDNIYYWVAPNCEEWTDYYWPYKTLGEAKAHAKECISIEHCDVYISKTFKKIVKEG